MNTQEFVKALEDLKAAEENMLGIKGADYSDGKDRLSNFKIGAERLGMTKYQIWAVYFGKHLDSIMGAIRNNPACPETKSEPIQGRIVDARNYLMLLFALMEEDKPKPIIQTVSEEILSKVSQSNGLFHAEGINHSVHVLIEEACMENDGLTHYKAECKCGYAGSRTSMFEIANKQAKEHWEAVA